jgi:hypothetical protein
MLYFIPHVVLGILALAAVVVVAVSPTDTIREQSHKLGISTRLDRLEQGEAVKTSAPPVQFISTVPLPSKGGSHAQSRD